MIPINSSVMQRNYRSDCQVYVYVCVYVCMYVCMYVYMYICMYVCVCVYVCVCDIIIQSGSYFVVIVPRPVLVFVFDHPLIDRL